MALRSFDSQTRLGIPRPPKSERAPHSERAPQPAMQGEQYADEGTLILEPSSPISIAPSSFIPPPPPSSMRPMMYSVPPPSSVRPPMPSWDDRSGWAPSTPNEVTKSTRIPPKSTHSASAMILMATFAALAALMSIGFMQKSKRTAENETPVASAAPPPVVVESNAAVIPAPVAPPAQAIDMDDDAKPAAPVAAPKPVVNVNVAPAQPQAAQPQVTPVVRTAPPSQAAPAPAAPAKKAPSQTAQQKALEDLLDQLGEEQLKR